MKKRPARPSPPPSRRRRIARTLRRGAVWALPLILVAFGYGAFALSRMPEGQKLLAAAVDRAVAGSAALGLVVSDIEVSGRETTEPRTIMAALAAERGTPILAISPSRAKQQLEALPWVRSAAIERRLPGTLFVRLVERRPLAVWQHGGKQELIDREGEVIPVKDLGAFAKLPSVIGDDAARHAAALLDMLAHEPQLAARVTDAVRVDGRRWNVRIDHAIEVMLPEEDAIGAWARLAGLERDSKLLQRDIQIVDMRLPDRLVLRTVAGPSHEIAPAKKPRLAGKST